MAFDQESSKLWFPWLTPSWSYCGQSAGGDSSLAPFSASSPLVSSSSHPLTKVHGRPCDYVAFDDWKGYLPDYKMMLWFYYFCNTCLPGALSMALKWGAEQPCHLCQPPAHLLLLSEVRIGSEGAARLEMHNPRTMLVSAFCMAPGSSWEAICYAVWSVKLGLYGWNLHLTLSLVSSVTMGKLKSYRQFPHL